MSALLTVHDVTAGYVADIDILRHVSLHPALRLVVHLRED